VNDKKTLTKEGLIENGTKLNHVSEQVSTICNDMYVQITKLRDNGSFQTIQDASIDYYSKIEELQKNVPKFTEAILKFSSFLSQYVIDHYQDLDEELRQKVETNLAEAIEKLGGLETNQSVDYSKISATAQGALSGNFIDSGKIKKSAFDNSDGELQFVTRPDGSVQIVRDGTILGYTTQEGIGTSTSTSKTESVNEATAGAETILTAGATTAGTIAAAVNQTATPAIDPNLSITPDVANTLQTAVDQTATTNNTTPIVTTTQTGTLQPGDHYTAQSYQLSEEDKRQLMALVGGEDNHSYEGALAVASTILNRCESPQWSNYGGSNPLAQAKAKGQFVAWNGNITKSYLKDSSKIPNYVEQAVEDALNGTRNHSFTRFRANTNPGKDRVQIGENGNYYF